MSYLEWYIEENKHVFTFLDIDECATGADECMNGASCVNTAGSYLCTCEPGWTGRLCQTGELIWSKQKHSW